MSLERMKVEIDDEVVKAFGSTLTQFAVDHNLQVIEVATLVFAWQCYAEESYGVRIRDMREVSGPGGDDASALEDDGDCTTAN